jgi:adenine-specific DNA-methyltransferase
MPAKRSKKMAPKRVIKKTIKKAPSSKKKAVVKKTAKKKSLLNRSIVKKSVKASNNYEIIKGDILGALEKVPDKSIQLIVTSPPYNIGKSYERESNLTLKEYLFWLEKVITALSKKVKPSGSICWQVGNYIKDGEIYPLDFYFYEIFKRLGFKLRNRIIWRFNFGLNASNRFSGRYETLLWFTKSDKYKFNLDPVRVPQLYPGKRHSSSKGEKAGQPSGNPKGKNPSDYWEFSAENVFNLDPVWDMPNVKANHPEKTIHPCQFPVELVERCILAFSEKNDKILDPFVGTGASIIAALKHKRIGIGIDKDANYVALAKKRIKDFESGKLKLRDPGRAIRRPQPNEKVATVPKEWQKKESK